MNSVKDLCQTKTFFLLLISALLFIPNDGLCLGFFDAGVHFTGSLPQSEFKEITDQSGYGVSATALFKMGLLPLKLGVEIGSFGYGKESEKTNLTGGIAEVESETKNFTGHVILRLQQGVGDFAPYVDCLLGVNVISTETSVKGKSGLGNIPSFSPDYKDAAFSYGIGAGLMYKLARFIPIAGPAIFLDIKARYLFGGESEFKKEGSLKIENGVFKFDKDKFNSNQMIYHVGVMIGF